MLVGGYSFFHGQLTLGLGLGANQIGLSAPGEDGALTDIANVAGFSGHLGVLWSPAVLPVRVGASLRLSPQASFDESRPTGIEPDSEGNYVSEGYYLPRTISLPSEVHVGVAWQLFGPNYTVENPRRRGGGYIAGVTCGGAQAPAEQRSTRWRKRPSGEDGEALEERWMLRRARKPGRGRGPGRAREVERLRPDIVQAMHGKAADQTAQFTHNHQLRVWSPS